MPPFIRKRRGWDWVTPAVVRHLPANEKWRLTNAAMQAAIDDNLAKWLWVPAFIFPFVALKVISRDTLAFPGLFAVDSVVVGFGLVLLGVTLFGLPSVLRQRHIFRKTLRTQMLAAGIRPAACFDCGYFTEGFEGDECPNCGAALVAPKPVPPESA